MIWFTSDFHLYHKNCLMFDNRPFTTLGEMHDKLIRNWNEVVTNADTVYYLGDVSFGRPDKTRDILYSLNGNIVLIKGNHDQRIERFVDRFSSVHDYLELKKERIVMSHYPSCTWNWMHYNSIMLHGHCHGNLRPAYSADGVELTCKRLDVGCMNHNYYPISIDEVHELVDNIPLVTIDHHKPKDGC